MRSGRTAADTKGVETLPTDRCPVCGSNKLALQGRHGDHGTVRELVCVSCREAWPLESNEAAEGLAPATEP
jgi:DNA-directed RNA polymerase subunit M/transcription elongation factor TFIIS